MSEVNYVVRRAFRYGAVQYRVGDVFEPQGSRNDETLIRRFCREERVSGKKKGKGEKNGKQPQLAIETTAGVPDDDIDEQHGGGAEQHVQ